MFNISYFKPGVPRRVLLFVAAGLWTIAGLMLFYRGFFMLDNNGNDFWLKIFLVAIAGGLFYWKIFSKLSLKHTLRILKMEIERPCLFSFFNARSYLMMVLMISIGITLRKSGIISPHNLSFLYLTMAIPLLLSSVRFYYTGIYYRKFLFTI